MADINKEVESLLVTQDEVHYTEDGEVIRHFDQLLQDAEVQRIKNGEKIEPALGRSIILICRRQDAYLMIMKR